MARRLGEQLHHRRKVKLTFVFSELNNKRKEKKPSMILTRSRTTSSQLACPSVYQFGTGHG